MVACVTVTLGAAVPLDACECVRLNPLSPAVRIEADFIFEGRVVEIIERDEHIRTTRVNSATGETRPIDRQIVFDVLRGWRGVRNDRFTLTSMISDCMFAFEVGRQYLVFANIGDDGRPTTSICTRTSAAADAGAVLAYLASPTFTR
jgi:hypothetical protein